MVYILDEIVTKIILLPKYQQFSLKPGPMIGKNFPLRMMYTLGRKPQDWRIGSVPQVYKKNANGYGGCFMRECPLLL
jgi:hypothetical protein